MTSAELTRFEELSRRDAATYHRLDPEALRLLVNAVEAEARRQRARVIRELFARVARSVATRLSALAPSHRAAALQARRH